MERSLTLQVPKGTKVDIREVDVPADDDPRIPDDRNVIISAGNDMRLAIKRIDGSVKAAKASVILMCG